MPTKTIDEIAAGDVLATDLTNSQGAVLIKTGTRIGESHMRMLRMWGIESIEIANAEAGGGETIEPTEKLLDQAEAEIKERFGDSLGNEVMAEILRVAVELRAMRIATEAV